jgi:hypothetical protein
MFSSAVKLRVISKFCDLSSSSTYFRDYVVIPDYFWGEVSEMTNLGSYSGIDIIKVMWRHRSYD